jgi:hypothetical protein
VAGHALARAWRDGLDAPGGKRGRVAGVEVVHEESEGRGSGAVGIGFVVMRWIRKKPASPYSPKMNEE